MAERGAPRRRHRGFGARGGFKRQHQAEGAAAGATEEDFESPELKSLRQKHGEHVSTVLAVFPDWDDESVLFALSEAGGSVELAISRIAEGQAEQWGSVKGKKQPKKDSVADSGVVSHENSTGPSVRGSVGTRGRGRGDFRGGRGGLRGGARGGRGGAVSSRRPANGTEGSAPEAHVTELTDISANADGTITATTVTETQIQGAQELSVKETVTDAAGATIQVEEAISSVDKPKATAPGTNGRTGAIKPIPAVGKRSWAQIARPPSPKVQPAPVPKAQETTPAPAPAAEPEAPAAVVAAIVEEAAPIVIIETEAQAPSSTTAQDPWSSTPAAANIEAAEAQASEPAPLGVGEAWAESVLAQEHTQPSAVSAEEQAALSAQHQRAEEAAPPAGVNPAGGLDVHTPAADELAQQQTLFGQQPPTQIADRMAPPGLNKRSGANRGKQDAAVVMPGTTPDIEKMGVQFGSLNLFGSVPSQAEEAPSAPQQALYETPSVQELIQSHAQQQEQPVQQEQTYQQQQTQAPSAQYDYQQQAQAQYAQPEAQKQSLSSYPAGLDRFGTASQQQQQYSQQPAASAYASRYQPFGQSAQQQQQQDPFASITSQYAQNANTAQHSSIPSLGGADSISPYYSSQQSQPQSQQAAHVQSTPSPAPASVRDTNSASAQQAAQSAYGGFTSALGQNAQAQQQHQGYQSDYSNVYGMPDPMRGLQNYYSQYEQASQPSRASGNTDDLSSKLGASSANSASGLSQQSAQQQHQQQQQYPPNMMHYGYPYYPPYGMPHNYGGMNPNYPGYASQHSPYAHYGGGYGGARGGYPGAPHSSSGGGGNAYGRGSGAYGNAAPGLGGNVGQQSASYGQGAYGSFDTSRGSNQGVNAGSGQGSQSQGQQDRGANSKDVFGDRFFGGGY